MLCEQIIFLDSHGIGIGFFFHVALNLAVTNDADKNFKYCK